MNEANITPDELQRCISVLETILEDRTLLAGIAKEDRVKLLVAAGKLSRPERLEIMKMSKVYRRARHREARAKDRSARSETGIRAARTSAVYVPPPQLLPSARPMETKELENPRNCYVCKKEFKRLHFFYDSMCPECGDFNYAKRFQSASLAGRVALITGSRLKIGYQSSLMMLRAGARVIATTRFPHDSATRYSREPDFAEWGHRLEVYGLDLRHSPSVETFARYVCHKYDRLDILINNAAQTVRRPPGFYKHMLEQESLPASRLSREARSVLQAYEECKSVLSGQGLPLPVPGTADSQWVSTWHGNNVALGLQASAALSQLPYAFEDQSSDRELFPEEKYDADLQQVDLRHVNSWRFALADVPTPEMLEVQLVNAIAPFILCSKLKPLMLRAPGRDKHIVNVSAMEGVFSRHTKTDKHPHTNMAKAALNMMTLTSAQDYVKDGIHMNAVDTGWVTDEDPHDLSLRKQAEHDFQPPLDIVDGAARVCDPFFAGLNTGIHVWGKFLKDYAPSSW